MSTNRAIRTSRLARPTRAVKAAEGSTVTIQCKELFQIMIHEKVASMLVAYGTLPKNAIDTMKSSIAELEHDSWKEKNSRYPVDSIIESRRQRAKGGLAVAYNLQSAFTDGVADICDNLRRLGNKLIERCIMPDVKNLDAWIIWYAAGGGQKDLEKVLANLDKGIVIDEVPKTYYSLITHSMTDFGVNAVDYSAPPEY